MIRKQRRVGSRIRQNADSRQFVRILANAATAESQRSVRVERNSFRSSSMEAVNENHHPSPHAAYVSRKLRLIRQSRGAYATPLPIYKKGSLAARGLLRRVFLLRLERR